MMTDRPSKVREWQQNEHPESAAETAATRFERDAIPVPSSLVLDDSAPAWQRQAFADAVGLYRTIVIAGAAGIRRKQLLEGLGRKRAEDALKILRASATVAESEELAPNSAGVPQEQSVFRVSSGLLNRSA